MSQIDQTQFFMDYNKYSKFTTTVWITTRVLEFINKTKSPNISFTLADLYKQAEVLVLINIQFCRNWMNSIRLPSQNTIFEPKFC